MRWSASSTNAVIRASEVASALYTTDILRLATTIPHLGRLADAHGTSERRSPLCGSRITVDVRTDAQGRVTDLGQVVSACALGQAAANLMASRVIGHSATEIEDVARALADWLAGRDARPADWPELAVFEAAVDYPARHGAICLPFEAAAEAAGRATNHA